MTRHEALEEETSPSSFSSHSDPPTYPSLIYLCIELRALGMLGKSSIPSSRYLFSPSDFFTRDMSGSDPNTQYQTARWAILWRALFSFLWVPLPGTPEKSG